MGAGCRGYAFVISSWGTAVLSCLLDDAHLYLRHDELGCDDDRENAEKNGRDLVPLERVERLIERDADPARADVANSSTPRMINCRFIRWRDPGLLMTATISF